MFSDQGWGDKKGKLYLVRVDPSTGKEMDWYDLYKGTVPREDPYTAKTYVKDTAKVFANAKDGVNTTYRIYAKSGGSGGKYRLYLYWTKINIKNTV